MCSQDLQKMLSRVIDYEVSLNGENTKTILIKGNDVENSNLILLVWQMISMCYTQMNNRKDPLWKTYARYVREKITEIIPKDEFWEGSLRSNIGFSDAANFSEHKFISIKGMANGDYNTNLLFKADNGLYGTDYLYGLCSVVQKTYRELMDDDKNSAIWFKYSLQELFKIDSYWTPQGVSENQMEMIEQKFYDNCCLFS